MGIEDGEVHQKLDERANAEPAADPAVTEGAAVETPGDGHVPVEVFDRLADLQRQLDEAQGRLDRQRVSKNKRQQRWRAGHREQVRAYDRERKRREYWRGRSDGQE